jgi:hypothetical protein
LEDGNPPIQESLGIQNTRPATPYVPWLGRSYVFALSSNLGVIGALQADEALGMSSWWDIMKMRIVARVGTAFAVAAISSVIHGETFTGTGPGSLPGETLSASATFTVSNLELIVTLSNTGTFDPQTANDILTAVFFTLDGDPKLTPESAQLAPGSSVIGHRLPLEFTGDVSSQWAYKNDLVGAPDGTDEGISSTDLKWFNTKNALSKDKIKGFGSLNGVSFGLTTPDDLGGHDRGNLKNQGLTQNSVVLTFGGLPTNFSIADISDVTFQYGTSPKAPEFLGEITTMEVPEPSTIALVAFSVLATAGAARLGIIRKPTRAH